MENMEEKSVEPGNDLENMKKSNFSSNEKI